MNESNAVMPGAAVQPDDIPGKRVGGNLFPGDLPASGSSQ